MMRNNMSSSSSSSSNPTRQSRIPFALQAVFLASNRGNDVNKPPPNHAGNKVYRGNWLWQKISGAPKVTAKKSNTKGHVDGQGSKSKKEDSNSVELQQQSSFKAMSPQAFLDLQLCSRGYSTQRHKSLRSAYHNTPTPLQQASYDVHLIGLVRKNDMTSFEKIMASGSGLSQNPSNRYGASLVHTVCRHGNHQMLDILMRNGASVQVCDDYGRTPLHDACWAAEPAFETVHMVLKSDSRLFHMIDSRGHVPLNYVRQKHWDKWVNFLKTNLDVYWPAKASGKQDPPPLTRERVNTRPLPDPSNALSLELAQMVASGRMAPKEAMFLNNDDNDDDDNRTRATDDEDVSSYFSSDYDSDEDSEEESESYWSDDEDSDYAHEEEMKILLNGLPTVRAQMT